MDSTHWCSTKITHSQSLKHKMLLKSKILTRTFFSHKFFFKISDLVVLWLLEEARIKRTDGEGEIIKMEVQR